MKLDTKGRCCGRKPIVYKRSQELFCSRCDRSYRLLPPHEQIENWAWRKVSGQWEERPIELREHIPLKIRTERL